MERLAKHIAINLGITATTTAICLLIALIIGAIVAEWEFEARTQIGLGRIQVGSVEENRIKREARNSVMGFGAWAGLLIGQTVFLAYQWERMSRQPQPASSTAGDGAPKEGS